MNPQLEDGYTKIADKILENTAKLKLNGTQLRIVLIVWRYTYGFNRKETDLSVTFLANALDIGKRPIQRELKALIDMGVLIEKAKPSFNSTRIIQFNKRHLMSKKTPDAKLDTSTDVGLDTSTDVGLDTQEREPKDNTKYSVSDVVKYYKENCNTLPQANKITEARRKSINARLSDYGYEKVIETLDKAESSSFLVKTKEKRWLNFDWIFNPNNFIKILEGNYSESEVKKVTPRVIPQPSWVEE